MSESDFIREFRQETGRPPGEYVISTWLSLKGVVQRSGFGTVAAMRRAFMPRVGMAPRQYRGPVLTDRRGGVSVIFQVAVGRFSK